MDKYYLEQLRLLREGASAFGQRYPALAPMLLTQGGDPDAERILEGTAYLCSKIHARLDETAPDLIQSLLRLVFPQSIMPIPSSTLMQFTLLPNFSECLDIPKGTHVASKTINGVSCIYTTIHKLRVFPISITSVTDEKIGESTQKVTITLSSPVAISSFFKDNFIFYLVNEYSIASQHMYILLSKLTSFEISIGNNHVLLPPENVIYCSLPMEDMRISSEAQYCRSYMDINRYLYFPEHLLRFQLKGIEKTIRLTSEKTMKITFYIDMGKEKFSSFSTESFAVNVVPAENIFRVQAEPIEVTHNVEEYIVRPQDGQKHYLDILSIENVKALLSSGRVEECLSYDFLGENRKGLLYSYRMHRNEATGRDEVLLSPLYAGRREESMPFEQFLLSLELKCCNYSLPNKLQAGDICRHTDNSPSQASFFNIVAPSPFFPRPRKEKLLWRFLSYMNSNLIPIASAKELRSLLLLFLTSPENAPELVAAHKRRFDAIQSFSSSLEERLFRGRLFRGWKLFLELERGGFASLGDLAIFAAVLDRVLTYFVPINNYTQLNVSVVETGESWSYAPRLGEKQFL